MLLARALSKLSTGLGQLSLFRHPAVTRMQLATDRRLALEFGIGPAGSGLYLLGLGKDEHLAPRDIQALCEQLGVPAEDFGVES